MFNITIVLSAENSNLRGDINPADAKEKKSKLWIDRLFHLCIAIRNAFIKGSLDEEYIAHFVAKNIALLSQAITSITIIVSC